MAKTASGLSCPQSYLDADPNILEAICNGCGAAGAKFDFVPDNIYCLKITEACQVHDWMYHKGRSIGAKEKADRTFLNNLIRLIDMRSANTGIRFLRRRRAKKYYLAVKHFGGPAFWKGKE